MKNLIDKKILYIICGGISAYKSLETIRLFKKNGAQIKSILTNSAKEFITPLSVASLSQGKVYSDLFSVENETEMDHIALSRWADVILIAPATANTISKLAQGTTDDLASTVVLASNKEIYLAPAMNVRMWEHQSTKQNLKKLKSFGYKIIGPEIGEMACGEYSFIRRLSLRLWDGRCAVICIHLLVIFQVFCLNVGSSFPGRLTFDVHGWSSACTGG